MIPGAYGKKFNVELSDYEVGALLKGMDACILKGKIRFEEEMDNDDFEAFDSAIIKLMNAMGEK